MNKKFYDLDQVKGISIEKICAAFGIKIDRTKKCNIRDEKTPSCQLYTKNSNGQDSFYDFGSNIGGDVIHFVMQINNCNWQTALETLADNFGIEPINNTDYQNRNELTDYQYSKIGVYGDLATKNFDFDLERFSFESAQKFSDKYHMSVNELRKLYPGVYTQKILFKRALPFVSDLRNSYYFELHKYYQLAKMMNISNLNKIGGETFKQLSSLKDELSLAERLLRKAVKGTSLEESISPRNYDVNEDYLAVINGEVAFQIGPASYHDIKNQARQNDEVLHYRSVSLDEYYGLKEQLDNVSYAAFCKGDKVNLAYLPAEEPYIENSIAVFKFGEQISDVSFYDVRNQADKQGLGICYRSISNETYEILKNTLSKNISMSVFDKSNSLTLVFSVEHEETIDKTLKSLNVLLAQPPEASQNTNIENKQKQNRVDFDLEL